MQFLEKFVFLLFLAIQNVCSMQNLDDQNIDSQTMEMIADINMLPSVDYSDHEKETMIIELMLNASKNSSIKVDQKQMQRAEDNQRKSAAEERRFLSQCPEKVQIQMDECFCGMRKGIKNVEDEFEQWCRKGSYCYDSYTSNSLRDAACYDHRPCSETSPEGAKANGDLKDICLCGTGHTECGPGKYCSEEGQCLSENQHECRRNTKVVDECMCGYKTCQRRSVCVPRKDIPLYISRDFGNSNDQCMEFCDTSSSPMGENGGCICSAPNSNKLEITFCESTQTCMAVHNKPECTNVDMEEDETEWDEWE